MSLLAAAMSDLRLKILFAAYRTIDGDIGVPVAATTPLHDDCRIWKLNRDSFTRYDRYNSHIVHMAFVIYVTRAYCRRTRIVFPCIWECSSAPNLESS